MPPDSLAELELLVMLAALRLGPEEAYTVSIADVIQDGTGVRYDGRTYTLRSNGQKQRDLSRPASVIRGLSGAENRVGSLLSNRTVSPR